MEFCNLPPKYSCFWFDYYVKLWIYISICFEDIYVLLFCFIIVYNKWQSFICCIWNRRIFIFPEISNFNYFCQTQKFFFRNIFFSPASKISGKVKLVETIEMFSLCLWILSEHVLNWWSSLISTDVWF